MSDTKTPVKWTIAKLKADAEFTAVMGERIYNRVNLSTAPLTYPYTVVTKVPTPPTTNNEARVIFWNDLVQVVIYDAGASEVRAAAMANRALVVLDRATGTTDEGAVIACVVEQETPPMTILDEGSPVQAVGYEFRVYSQ